ncbi:very-long-chain 3-oxoacyl-CoA reductase 1-like [Triticum dicoccoides]|uniref:very-long-chain 3-oxoacyl-CoA reductase 1-like n=1 Tax=Triticum dicoccoides TaxID=85692 RepID=UPI00188E267F|nr:very-long-chain 3-oxoacyl-CoA reductase 1-like [Triticum dicoccoides]
MFYLRERKKRLEMGALLFRQPQEPAWFASLAILGALHVAAVAFRILSHLVLLLRRPTDLCHRYGAWAVVTGPTSGMGRSVALALAQRGLNLVLVGRDPAKLQDISDTISCTYAVQTKTVVVDLALIATPQGDEALRLLRHAVAGLDVGVLVNNAGLAKPCAVYLHEADVEAWVRMIRVNLWALTEVTAAVLPGMVERGRGAIVNIGSGTTLAIPSFPLLSIYAASKRYVAQLSRSLHVEYRGKGIDVQCQVPLFVETNMTLGVAASRKRRSLLSRLIMPTSDEYARAAVCWIGHGPLCMPNLGHRLEWCMCHAVPDWMLDELCLRLNLWHRVRFQRLRTMRASRPNVINNGCMPCKQV